MATRALLEALGLPFRDLFRGQARVLARPRHLVILLLGLAVGWWVYVPVHELLHAAGCALAGGEVTRLEIAPEYGGALLARAFPFVVAGGDYAGRLAGFDTGGSDLVYLATDLAPFVLTLFPGVWLLRLGARQGRVLLFAAALPMAFAPLLSLPGDAYEIGSLVVTNAAPWRGGPEREVLRGDDLVRAARALREALASGGGTGGAIRGPGGKEIAVPGARPHSAGLAWSGLALATLLGAVWAWATYMLGSLVASALGQRPLRPAGRTADESAVRGPDGWRVGSPS